MHEVVSIESESHLCETILAKKRVRGVGGGSKLPRRNLPTETVLLNMERMKGIVEYDPFEFTITVQAGTSVQTVQETLAAQGQFLPFDPPLREGKSTIGGLVAAGLSGPSRLRYGSIRDFILGVRFVDGLGKLVTGGGKVVKNAAGFDLPKLMVGSWGQLGVLVEITFKVFPRLPTYQTCRIACDNFAEALALQTKLLVSPLEIEAIDLLPPGTLLVRLAGNADSVVSTRQRLASLLSQPALEVLEGEAEALCWEDLREWRWHPTNHSLLRLPITPSRIIELENWLSHKNVLRRYSVAGNVAWLAWPEDVPENIPENVDVTLLDTWISQQQLNGRILHGREQGRLLGRSLAEPFARQVTHAIDPESRFQ